MRVSPFQFHKGTIRTNAISSCDDAFSYFNSIKVRLEPTTKANTAATNAFQFHKGTIRTPHNRNRNRLA